MPIMSCVTPSRHPDTPESTRNSSQQFRWGIWEDARSEEGRRRLSVCARDVYRLVDRFRGTAVAQMDEYGLLERLLREQCHVGRHRTVVPERMPTMRQRGRCR